LLLGSAWALAEVARAVPDRRKGKLPEKGPIRDRAGFIPTRCIPLKGTAVGVLTVNPHAVQKDARRYGTPEQILFTSGDGSHRVIYVPTEDENGLKDLAIPVGQKGKTKVYPRLKMANPQTARGWGITEPYALVEVQVNDGLGSPAGTNTFVAGKVKRLDGTREYPLKVTAVVKTLCRRYEKHCKSQEGAVKKAMDEARKKILKEKQGGGVPVKWSDGPGYSQDLIYVTWLAESKTLRVHFRTTVSDWVSLGLPQKGGGIRRPPAPASSQILFGVELGMAYEVSRTGRVMRARVLPLARFQHARQPPQSGGDFNLPAKKVLPK
jgi:hypothetical protein